VTAADIRELLAPGAASGVHEVDGPPSQDVLVKIAAAHDYALFRIDCSHLRDASAFFAASADAMRFPSWFGRNWDAFEELISSLSWRPARGYLLVLDAAAAWRRAAPADADMAREILAAAAESWASRGVAFHALWAGGGTRVTES
jgi:hypothetical protein